MFMTSKHKISFSHFALFLCAALMAAGCHKKESLGETVCPTSAFKFTTPFAISSTTVDPSVGKLNIIAAFSEPVDWILTIKGDHSQAVKTFSAKTDSLNVDFYGNSSSEHFFQAEPCTVVLELGCGLGSTTLHYTYSKKPAMKNIDFGTMIIDFDSPSTYSILGGWGNDLVKQVVRTASVVKDTSAQGGKAMLYYGAVIDSTASPVAKLWYYGGFSSGIIEQLNILKSAGVTDPSRIYLNMYIRGYNSTHPNTQLQLSLEGQMVNLESGSVMESKNNNISVDWDGWRMVSIKFSEFVNLHPFTTTAGIGSLGMGLGAGPEQNSKSKLLLDFVILTVDAPYKEIVKRNY